MPKTLTSTVLIQCSRRGSVTAGPLTVVHGVNEVSIKDFEEFKKTKLGGALVKQRVIEYAPEPIEEETQDAPKESSEEDDATSSEENKAPPAAPSLAFDVKAAIEFVKALEDEDVLLECYEQETRKTVKAACEERAEELTSKDEPGDNEPGNDGE